MLKTLRHGDKDRLVVIAKLLTGFVTVKEKVEDADSFIRLHQSFEADFVAHVVAWQGNHGVKADGVIGKDTWTAIAENAPTCSTSKNKTSGYTMAVQMLVDGNLTCDAIYGSRTKAAVAAFQEACALKADGICGPKTWKALVGVKEEQGKHINPCVHYLQWDKRWKNIMYSNHGDKKQTIGNSGCGPSAVAQVVATWIDPAITPVEMCKLSLDNGYRTKNSGTKGDFCIFVADKYPQIEKCTRTGSVKTVKSALKQGALAVCCMNSNDDHFWTNGGHYITAIGYDDKGYIYANDPNKEKAPRKQLQDKFQSCLKQAWILWHTAKAEDEIPDPFDGVNDSAGGTPKRGDAIVDISKYQPTVNYDKFIKATALIILRAGYRGTGGGIKEDQKFQLHANELTKRGVRFGVYFYSIAKTKEQAREEARMFWKYARGYKPLFWGMDAEKDSITKDAIVAFVEELRKQGAKKVGCYVANHLYQKYDYASIKDKMDFTWIPRYSNTPPVYECDMWQYTSTEHVDGISGNVDLNRITGQGHDIDWFCGGDA